MYPRDLENLLAAGWSDIESFYTEDEARRRSGEVDFGVQWRGQAAFPSYQLSWVMKTGELYLLELPKGRVAVIAAFDSRERLELSLDGWADACGPVDSLRWLFDWKDFGAGANVGPGRKPDRHPAPGRSRSSVEFRGASQILYD